MYLRKIYIDIRQSNLCIVSRGYSCITQDVTKYIGSSIVQYLFKSHTMTAGCCIYTNIQYVHNVLLFLKLDHNLRCIQLIDYFCIDLYMYRNRFLVIGHVLSYTYCMRIFIMYQCVHYLVTITSIYSNSAWYERELADLYGILPSIRMARLLSDYGRRLYPMRKDFPLSGYQTVRYVKSTRTVQKTVGVLLQEYRDWYSVITWPFLFTDA